MNEKASAKTLLERKEKGYKTIDGFFFIKNRLLFRAALAGVAYLIYLKSGDSSIFLLMLGYVLGMTFQDYGWFRLTVKTWEFTCKITDWDRVKDIAGENS